LQGVEPARLATAYVSRENAHSGYRLQEDLTSYMKLLSRFAEKEFKIFELEALIFRTLI
jgi:hypothetical protein